MRQLIIIRGLPGSGKSTLAASILSSAYKHHHLEADMYFLDDEGRYNFEYNLLGEAHSWCQEATHESLGAGFSVVVSNTFTTKKELRPYFKIADNYGIIPIVILAQNQFNNVHSVPEETLVRMKTRFEYDISDLFKELLV